MFGLSMSLTKSQCTTMILDKLHFKTLTKPWRHQTHCQLGLTMNRDNLNTGRTRIGN